MKLPDDVEGLGSCEVRITASFSTFSIFHLIFLYNQNRRR